MAKKTAQAEKPAKAGKTTRGTNRKHAVKNLGNQNALKFKTSEERKKLLHAYLKHVESGFSDEAFPECDMDTFNEYVVKFPIDFPTDMILRARRNRRLFWEEMGIKGSAGKLKGFNSKAWEFNMKNRFKHDWKEKQEIEHKGGLSNTLLLKDVIRKSKEVE